MTASRLVSIQVGMPKDLGSRGADNPLDRPWRSAILKEPVEGSGGIRNLGPASPMGSTPEGIQRLRCEPKSR